MSKQYYSLEKILSEHALYNIIYGQRANGKTYSVVHLMIEHYCKTGVPSAYIRRLDSELVAWELETLAAPHKEFVSEWTGGKYNDIIYKKRRFYLAHFNTETYEYDLIDNEPCVYCYALSMSQKAKGADRGKIAYTLFDEFLTRTFYLANEFIIYSELLSTIMRDRDGTIHFLVGNSVNKYCPYFNEMGLYNMKNQVQGTIDVYNYGDTGLKVAVEWCETSENVASVSKYFAFDNPQLNMIFKGVWETANYPHAFEKIPRSNIRYKAFIKFDGINLCMNVVRSTTGLYLYITKWTTAIPKDKLCFVTDHVYSPYECIDPSKCMLKIGQIINVLIQQERVFFVDNEIGEIYNNWLKTVLTRTIYKN